jgi:hypothetical protein
MYGPPDTFPIYGDMGSAWASALTGQKEWVHVRFNISVYPTGIDVYETFNPGYGYRMEHLDPNGQWRTSWSANIFPPKDKKAHIFSPTLCPLQYPITDIKYYLDGGHDSWAELDALGMDILQN